MTFKRIDPAPVIYLIEGSSNLTDWTTHATLNPGASAWISSDIVLVETGSGSSRQVHAYSDISTNPSAPKFLRLKITRP